MKTIAITALALGFSFMSFTSNSKITPGEVTTLSDTKTAVSWIRQEISVGEIPQGKPVTFEFEFTNTGKEPVLITEVKASCGCTTSDYSRSPVKPGEKGQVKAVYNAAAVGAFAKNVTVTTSADQSPVILTLKGTVVAAVN